MTKFFGCSNEDLNIKPTELKNVKTDDTMPKECPFCFDNSEKIYIYHYLENNNLQMIFLCNMCQKIFISYFKKKINDLKRDIFEIDKKQKMFGKFKKKKFENNIENFSPNFYKIYSQAKNAKQLDLYLIIGNSYRMTIEFLIKDYLIKISKKKINEIKKKKLFDCIKELDFKDDLKNLLHCLRIYGNEETHYEIKIMKNIKENIEEMENIIDIIINRIKLKLSLNKNNFKLPK